MSRVSRAVQVYPEALRSKLLLDRMSRVSKILLVIAVPMLTSNALAGGSFQPVIVKSLTLDSATDYELVVQPSNPAASGYKDPYFGSCPLFTVRGAYSRIHSALRLPEFVTRESHVAALAKLSDALKTSSLINFGWIGTGFEPIDPKTPCVVRSRALHLRVAPDTTVVLSLHNAV